MTRPYRLSEAGLAARRASCQKLYADPEFRQAASERMKRLHAEGRMNNKSYGFTPEQSRLFYKLRKAGVPKDDALKAAKS